MSNLRRERTREKLGFDTEKDIKRKEKAKKRAIDERGKQALRRSRIESHALYRTLVKGALGFDVVDALLGFLEVGGDFLSALPGLAYLYLSAFVVRSFRLSVAVFSVVVVDLLLGLVPVAGTVVDVLFCGNYINRSMIKGVVEGDGKTISRVNKVAVWGLLVAAALGYIVYLIVENIRR